MSELKGFQRKYLRGLAHSINPLVLIGQSGINDGVIDSVNEALNSHELIKIKFNAFKEKEEKSKLIKLITDRTKSELAGLIGHTAIVYRMHSEEKKRKINIPVK